MLILEYSWKIFYWHDAWFSPERSALLKKKKKDPPHYTTPRKHREWLKPPPPPSPLTSHHQQVKGKERSSAFPHCLYLSFHIWKRGRHDKKIVQLNATRANFRGARVWRGCAGVTLCRNTLNPLLRCVSQSRITPVWVQDSPQAQFAAKPPDHR